MRRGLVFGFLILMICLTTVDFVLGEAHSSVNSKYCGLACEQMVVDGSPIWCSNEYTFGLKEEEKYFCWSFNSAYCNFECVDESKNLASKIVCGADKKESCSYTSQPFDVSPQVCGDGICEEVEEEKICKGLSEFKNLINNFGLPQGVSEDEFLLSFCQPACYEDCGVIALNSGLYKPSDVISLPFSETGASIQSLELNEGECSKPVPLMTQIGWNENKGDFCLEEVSNNGVTLSYNGKNIFVEYYEPYNYAVDAKEGQDKYLYLTYNSLFQIYKPSNRFILFFKQFYV